jgi:hypothetical protein
LKVSVEELHVVFVGDEVVSGNFPSTFTYKSTEAQKERPDLTVSTESGVVKLHRFVSVRQQNGFRGISEQFCALSLVSWKNYRRPMQSRLSYYCWNQLGNRVR